MQGTSLGPYEILEQLGAGGMGEVWLAQDTRLGRKVAIKVLPPQFGSDRERLARFEQEARAAAALNHPNIAAVFDVGSDAGADGPATHFMVQEYLRGHSLRTVLEGGALETRRALALAAEIAEALKAAHGVGIVHRDLKPENVFVTEDGHAKVLDFGLAKLAEAPVAAGGMTQSPTSLGTAAGMVMGTAGYMAPEQARGETVDHRADLFAFGCVLYEMLAGRRAFDGDSVIQALNRVLYEEPEPLGSVAPGSPPELRRITAKCLRKRPDERYQTAADLLVDVRTLASGAVAREDEEIAAPPAPSPQSARSRAAVAALVAIALLAGYGAAQLLGRAASPVQRAIADVRLPLGLDLDKAWAPAPVGLSPDGRTVVFEGRDANGRVQLYRRDLSGGPPVSIPGTEDGSAPFFSPDGRWLGYHSPRNAAIMKVSLAGGAPSLIAPIAGYGTGAIWGADDVIILSANSAALRRVHASGGALETVTPLEDGESGHGAPSFLPGARQALLTILRGTDPEIAVVDLQNGQRTPLGIAGHAPFYVADPDRGGYLLYRQGTTLVAAPFDPSSLRLTGVPVEVLEPIGVTAGNDIVVTMAFYAEGTLLYVPPFDPEPLRAVWLSRDGEVTEAPAALQDHDEFDFDAAGTRVAATREAEAAVTILDLRSGTQWRLNAERPNYVALSPDGATLAYADELRVHLRAADGSDAPRQLLPERDIVSVPRSWSPDGGTLYFYKVQPETLRDIWTYRIADDVASPLIATEADERSPEASPDGEWLAYVSNAPGDWEVHVIDAAATRQPRQVSRGGGGEPSWSVDGSELFFRSDDGWFMVASVDRATGVPGEPRRLFEDRYTREQFSNALYGIAPDGRFLIPELVPGKEVSEVRLFIGFDEWVRDRVTSRQ